MATLTKKNPIVVQGPVMERVKLACADDQTWKAGNFLYLSSGLLALADDDNVSMKYLALADQAATGTASSTGTIYAEVGVITKDHVFEGNALSGTVSSANIGACYALDLAAATYIHTVDTTDTGHDCFIVIDVASAYEPSRNIAADVYGRLRFKVLQSVLDA